MSSTTCTITHHLGSALNPNNTMIDRRKDCEKKIQSISPLKGNSEYLSPVAAEFCSCGHRRNPGASRKFFGLLIAHDRRFPSLKWVSWQRLSVQTNPRSARKLPTTSYSAVPIFCIDRDHEVITGGRSTRRFHPL